MSQYIFSGIYSGATHQGMIRTNNEDTFICQQIWDDKHLLCAAIDGLGGYEGGEIAAELARATIIKHLEDFASDKIGETLKSALVAANNEIISQHEIRPRISQMGCVASVGIIDLSQGVINIAHVGDSRIYQFVDGELKKLTHDHSLVGYREETGELSEEDAMTHPKRNVIDKFLGEQPLNIDSEGYIEVSAWPITRDTQYLFCSDGLTDLVKSSKIKEVLSSRSPIEEKVQQLIAAANDAGGKDNITVVIADVQVDIIGGQKEELSSMPSIPKDAGKKRLSSKLRSLLLVLTGIIIGMAVFAGFNHWEDESVSVLDVYVVPPDGYEENQKILALEDSVRKLKDSICKMECQNNSLQDIGESVKDASEAKQLELKPESQPKGN